MNFAVLANPPNGSVKELTRAAGDRHSIELVCWDQLSGRFDGSERAGVPDRKFDAWIVRSMPAGSCEQVIFQMNVLGRMAALGEVILNSPRSLEIAIDKYLTFAILSEAGLPLPRTIVCLDPGAAMDAYEVLGRDVVLKPVFGGEGRGIVRVTDPELALRAFRSILRMGEVVYMQEFVAHAGHDYRLFVIGDEVIGMKRENPGDFRTNASRGAICSPHVPGKLEREIAWKAARVAGLDIAGVDIVYSRGGELLVLEVNGIPGWKRLASASGVDIASRILRHVEERCSFSQARSSPTSTVTPVPRSKTLSP